MNIPNIHKFTHCYIGNMRYEISFNETENAWHALDGDTQLPLVATEKNGITLFNTVIDNNNVEAIPDNINENVEYGTLLFAKRLAYSKFTETLQSQVNDLIELQCNQLFNSLIGKIETVDYSSDLLSAPITILANKQDEAKELTKNYTEKLNNAKPFEIVLICNEYTEKIKALAPPPNEQRDQHLTQFKIDVSAQIFNALRKVKLPTNKLGITQNENSNALNWIENNWYIMQQNVNNIPYYIKARYSGTQFELALSNDGGITYKQTNNKYNSLTSLAKGIYAALSKNIPSISGIKYFTRAINTNSTQL